MLSCIFRPAFGCYTLQHISTSIWVLGTPDAGWNMLFQCFTRKKLKKGRKTRKLWQNLAICPTIMFFPTLLFYLLFFSPHTNSSAALLSLLHRLTRTDTTTAAHSQMPLALACTPLWQDYLQSLTPSYALQLCSFPRLTAASVILIPVLVFIKYEKIFL